MFYYTMFESDLVVNNQIDSAVYFNRVFVIFLIWCMSFKVVSILLNKYSMLDHIHSNRRLEAKTRIISSLHSVILSINSVCYLSNSIGYATWAYYLPISGAFGVFDLCIVTLNYESFRKGYWATCTHHIVLLLGPLLTTTRSSAYISQAYLFEITVPILDAGWYMYQTQMNDTLFFKSNSILAVAFFFIFRVLNSTYLTYITLIEHQFAIASVSSIFLFLNIFWFRGLIRVFVKGVKKLK